MCAKIVLAKHKLIIRGEVGKLNSSQSAFTIIEVLFFLAISSFLLFIAMSTITGKSEQVRFQQSIGSIESLIVQQQGHVQNGVVPDGVTPECQNSGDHPCVVIGRVVEFQRSDPSTVKIWLLTGDSQFRDGPEYRPVRNIAETTPRPIEIDTIEIDWQSEFKNANFIDFEVSGDNISADNSMIAFIRVPTGTEIIPVGIKSTAATDNILRRPCAYDPTATACSTSTTIDSSLEAKICFADPNSRLFAYVNIREAQRRQAVSTEFLAGASCV